jgi:hypothetical protein
LGKKYLGYLGSHRCPYNRRETGIQEAQPSTREGRDINTLKHLIKGEHSLEKILTKHASDQGASSVHTKDHPVQRQSQTHKPMEQAIAGTAGLGGVPEVCNRNE